MQQGRFWTIILPRHLFRYQRLHRLVLPAANSSTVVNFDLFLYSLVPSLNTIFCPFLLVLVLIQHCVRERVRRISRTHPLQYIYTSDIRTFRFSWSTSCQIRLNFLQDLIRDRMRWTPKRCGYHPHVLLLICFLLYNNRSTSQFQNIFLLYLDSLHAVSGILLCQGYSDMSSFNVLLTIETQE